MYVIQTRGKKSPWVTIGSHRSKDMAVAQAFHLADELERELRVVQFASGMAFKVVYPNIEPRKES